MAALREAKRKGSKVLSIVNVMGSSIARESDYVLYTWAGPEIAVATTKAFTTQMVLLLMLGNYLTKQLNRIEQDEYAAIIRELQSLPEKISVILNNLEHYQKTAANYFNHNSIFYIGRNLDYALGFRRFSETERISLSIRSLQQRIKAWNHIFDRTGDTVVALATYSLWGKITV